MHKIEMSPIEWDQQKVVRLVYEVHNSGWGVEALVNALDQFLRFSD